MHIIWAIVNGSFRQSRDAILLALQGSGFDLAEIRQSWLTLRFLLFKQFLALRGDYLGSGKVAVAYKTLTNAQTQYPRPAVFMDLTRCGVKLTHLLLVRPRSGMEAVDLLLELVQSREYPREQEGFSRFKNTPLQHLPQRVYYMVS